MNRTDDRFCGGCAKVLRAPVLKKFDKTVPISIDDVLSEASY